MTSPKWLEGKSRYPVFYEDTDFSGYVYHANYLKYFERGREELVGLAYVRELYERGIHFVVARMELAFHAPARHGDTVEVRTRMRLSGSPITLVEQEAWCVPTKPADKDGVKLVTTTIKLVAVDKSGEAIRIPLDVAERFAAMAT
jgi:acyl-CoA thioester hydrolase